MNALDETLCYEFQNVEILLLSRKRSINGSNDKAIQGTISLTASPPLLKFESTDEIPRVLTLRLVSIDDIVVWNIGPKRHSVYVSTKNFLSLCIVLESDVDRSEFLSTFYELKPSTISDLYVASLSKTPFDQSNSVVFDYGGDGLYNRSLDDERHLINIALLCPEEGKVHSDKTHYSRLYIADIRPKINAVVQRAHGKGYESEKYYGFAKHVFLAVENVHVMRNCLNSILAGNGSPSQWTKHIDSLLRSSSTVASLVRNSANVLVHCSDGWDRTSQVCSLATILLCPWYRTYLGFKQLILRDWISFGHPFIDRLALCEPLGPKKTTAVQTKSPVFIQFLDSVHQLCLLFPKAFEFNDRFLAFIYDTAISGTFAEFNGNTLNQRRNELGSPSMTFHLNCLGEHLSTEHTNLLYDQHNLVNGQLVILFGSLKYVFWDKALTFYRRRR
ncbi:hypothetical protein ACOME3_008624 [Neoechinorhynchus agilis]